MAKIFLQDQLTGSFLTGADQWTEDTAKARVFQSTLVAVVHAMRAGMTGVEVLVRFEPSGEGDVRLPVPPVATPPWEG